MYLLAAFITFNIVIIDRIPNTNLKKNVKIGRKDVR